MKEIGISIKFSNISDDDHVAIEEKASEYLQKKDSMGIIHLMKMVKCANQY